MKPFFSIIVPAYNVAPYLCECLDSVRAQTFADWECICVDDGSTDGSGAILDEYVAADTRFHVIHQLNAGVSAARNAALDVAQGEWVWCIDGDDVIRGDALQHILGVLSSSDIDAYAFGGYLQKSSICSDQDWPRLSANPPLIHTQKDLVAYEHFKTGAWIVIFRRTRFNLRYKPYSISEDILFNVSLYWQSKSVATDDAILYFYRQREGSAMSHLDTKGMDDAMRAAEEIVRLEGDNAELFLSSPRYVSFRRRTSLAGYKDRFMQLPNSEKTKIMGTWLTLQRSAIRAGFGYRYQRLAVAICQILPYGWLADVCIRFIIKLNDRSVFEAAASHVTRQLGFKRRRKVIAQ